jgi:hypothetical protein
MILNQFSNCLFPLDLSGSDALCWIRSTPSTMNITFENNPKVSINGTCLQGYIETTYDELVKVFGNPTELEGDKVTVEWILQFSDGTVASIYDWKLSETPMGTYRWHIGGKSQRAVDLVTYCMLVPV